MKRLLPSLFLSCAIACTSGSNQNNNEATAQSSPTPSANQSKQPAATFPNEEEEDSLEDAESRRNELESRRDEARENAIKYAQQNFPGWKVKGVITRQTFDKHFQVMLDLEKGTETKTVQLILRRFFSEKGEPYWKAEPFIAHNLSRQYQELAYLRFVAGQEYNLDECREIVLDNLESYEVPDSVREAIIESYQEASDGRDYEPYDPRY